MPTILEIANSIVHPRTFLEKMASKTRHNYDSLMPRQIRVLLLEPSHNTEAPIRFSFCVDHIDKLSGRYEALSYVWGEPILDWPLDHEDGSHICVTKNLDMALRQLRRGHGTRWLWADAACIDQKNGGEKGEQIQLMGEIFRSANCVVAWLGPGGRNEEAGMRILATAPRRTHYDAASFSTEQLRCICAFFDLEWFRRLWTIQECVLSSEFFFMYGASEITLERLIDVLKFSQWSCWGGGLTHPSVESMIMKHALRVGTIYDDTKVRNMSATKRGWRILDLVQQFGNHQCVDAHDRIFGLCGLAWDIRSTPLQAEDRVARVVYMDIDYSSSIQQSYTTFAIACMKSGMVSEVLGAASERRQQAMSSNWPTWVSDWRIQPTQRSRLALEGSRGTFDLPRENLEWKLSRVTMVPKTKVELQIPRRLAGCRETTPQDHLLVDEILIIDSMDGLVRAMRRASLDVCKDEEDFVRKLTISWQIKSSTIALFEEAIRRARTKDVGLLPYSDPLFSERFPVMRERCFFVASLPEGASRDRLDPVSFHADRSKGYLSIVWRGFPLQPFHWRPQKAT